MRGYEYKKLKENGDATSNYDIVGKFPVKFADFSKQILENTNSFRVEFGASNECYGGWLGNRLEVHKPKDEDNWYITKEEPENWLEEIVNKNVTKCWANGGWGQMLYICTFEEE